MPEMMDIEAPDPAAAVRAFNRLPTKSRISRHLSSLPKTSIGIFAVYAIAGMAANWPTWPGDPDRIRYVSNFGGVGYTDQYLITWFLAWTPNALAHGANPFFTTFLNYPDGINLVQNTASPLLGLLAAPVTLLVSPIASYNLLIWLSFPLSAMSMYFVLRRFVRWRVATFVGGALYGFSPFVVDQSLYHLILCFVPLPPLIFLSTYELLRPGQRSPMRWGLALGFLVVGQFFISGEICTTTVMMGVAGVLLVAVYRWKLVPVVVLKAWKGVIAATAIVALFLWYPVLVMMTGPYRYKGTANPGGEGADLLSPLLPTSLERFSFGHLGVLGSQLIFGNTSENGGYLGLPLLVLMILVLVRYWWKPWVRFSGLMVLIAFVLSLGDHLDVNNHRTTFPLPFQLLDNLPVLNIILQVRFGLFVALFASTLVALGVDEMHTRRAGLSRDLQLSLPLSVRHKRSWRTAVPLVRDWGPFAMGALCFVTLIPNFPLATTTATVPAYFTTAAVDRIPQGSVVLISPYPSVFSPLPQLWQAVAGDRFKMIGGYGLFSTGPPYDIPDEYPPILEPEDVQMYLTGEANGVPFQSGPIPTLNERLECDLRTWLLRYNVGTVLSGPILLYPSANPKAIDRLFRLSLGPPSALEGSVTAWYEVPLDIQRTVSQFDCVGS